MLPRALLVVALVVALVVVAGAPARAQYVLTGRTPLFVPDPRSAGMAEAFTAFAEGPAASFWNPGALGRAPGAREVEAMPFSLRSVAPGIFKGADLYSAAAAVAFDAFGLGLDYVRLDYGDGGTPATFPETESTLRIAAGARLGRLLSMAPWIDVGIGAAWRQFDVDARPGVGSDGNASALDIGTLVVATKNIAPSVPGWHTASIALRGGFVLCNASDSDIDFDSGSSQPLGEHYRLGLGVEARLGSVEPFGDVLQARFGFETLDAVGKSGHGDFDRQSYGLETTFFEILSVRYGFHDAENYGIEDRALGFGIAGHNGHRYGGSFDFASVPATDGRHREEQYGLSGWARF